MNSPRQTRETREPPRKFIGTLGYLGPGMILAAGLVGSGELIATTKTGAQAGISLIWIILLGCIIKVFVQIELGRYTVSTNETTLVALNRIPGPRLGGNWIIWLWLVMMATTYGLLGGILGGVGQSLALIFPITGDYLAALQVPADATGLPAEMVAGDSRIWAILVAIFTALLLFFGRYGILETLCVGLVFCFTLITVGNVFALQTTEYAIPTTAILDGLFFGLPDRPEAWLTALAAFGIIGVGGTDLIVYPYWCLERGYGRFIGPRADSSEWVRRAKGWVRVMRIDAFVSMGIYTLTTLAFYFIGAAVLNRDGADPDGMRMVSQLAGAYEPIFGPSSSYLFLTGALAVLYSSFLVANAGAARLFADCLGVLNVIKPTQVARKRAIGILSLALPLLALLVFLTGWNPVRLIIVGGLVQSLVLPIIGFSAVYLRFKILDPRLRPGRAWDTALLLSCLSLLVVGLFSLARILSNWF